MVKPIRRKAKHRTGIKRSERVFVEHDELIDRFASAMETELSNHLGLVVRLQSLVNDPKVKDHSPRTEVGQLQWFFFRRVMNSLYAIGTLVTRGAVYDAKVVLRTMFEFAVSAAYLQAFPDHIERYKRFEAIEKYRWAKNLIDAGLLEQTKLDSWTQLKAAESGWQKEGLGQSYWTGKSFAKTVDACGRPALREFYEWFYPEASKFAHPSPTGLQWQIDSESKDLEWYPLRADAAIILGVAIGVCADVFRIYSEWEELGLEQELAAIGAEEKRIADTEKKRRAATSDEI